MYRHQQRDPAVLQLIFSLSFVAILAVIGGLGVTPANAGPPAAGVDLAGKAVDPLHAEPGKPVVLIFIRTDCPISNRYAPTIQRLSAQYAGKVAFWLVYPDKDETSAAIEAHLHEYGYKLPALHDPQHSLVKLGEAQITPEAAVFDAGGQLMYHGRIDNWYVSFGRARSAPTTHELDDALQAVLKGSKPEVATASAVGCYISDLE
jgi:thiol-disulfide isomerase/thioredoxin